MATSKISPRKKRLRLSRKTEEHNDEDSMPNKLSKSEIEIRKTNFMRACLKVSYEAYQDSNKRFLLLHLPECIINTCKHGDRNANIKQISRAAEHSFKQEIKNKTWFEALEICQLCITSCEYLSADVLKDIVEIMMNAHEDLETGYTIDYLLKKCQHTLMMHFNMHPPCVAKDLRNCYKMFLTSPMDRKELSNRKDYDSEKGIVHHCFSRLAHEIILEDNNETLIEQEIPSNIEGVKRLHWKKENLELFELLVRTERIERCMLVLESVIYLLQSDLALLHDRHLATDRQQRSQNLLLAYVLPPYKCVEYNHVSWLCETIMELFAYYIHLQYPERHIKTMTLWMNAVIQMIYINDTSCSDYPNTSTSYTDFSNVFYKIISPLPYTSILRILERIEPTFMQYLVGLRHVGKIIKFTRSCDILKIMIWCVDNIQWNSYPIEDRKQIICKKNTVKPHKLLNYLSSKCKSSNFSISVRTDSYPKLEVPESDSKLEQGYLIDALFTTFVAYLETYSIKKFNQTLDFFNENANEVNWDQTLYKSYSVHGDFVKQYRSIVESLQKLIKMLTDKQDEPSRKLLELIRNYFS